MRFFEERAWLVETIKSVFKNSHLIEVVLSFGREDETQIIWAFQWDFKENLN
ncbi:hypothetical protein THIOM_001996, partial [Candidatus Thiomargarita nelsonii]